jgi:hypothetical protein
MGQERPLFWTAQRKLTVDSEDLKGPEDTEAHGPTVHPAACAWNPRAARSDLDHLAHRVAADFQTPFIRTCRTEIRVPRDPRRGLERELKGVIRIVLA